MILIAFFSIAGVNKVTSAVVRAEQKSNDHCEHELERENDVGDWNENRDSSLGKERTQNLSPL